jgi:hypothetical protein
MAKCRAFPAISRSDPNMSLAKNSLLTGLLVLAMAGCAQEDAPEAETPAANAPAEAARPADAARPLPAKAQEPRVLTVAQVKEKRLPQQASCNLETVDNVRFKNTPFATAAKPVLFNGWLLPEISKKPGVEAEIRVLDATGSAGWQFRINHWMARPDVNAAMKAVDDGKTGFAQPADLSTLPAGNYKVLVTFRSGGTPYVCDNGRQLAIK